MNEMLFWAKVGNTKYPLLYNLQANAEFDEHYMDIVDDVDNLMEYFIGPQDVIEDAEKGITGDSPDVLKQKAKARKKATVFFKRELPWLIATLAKQGVKAAGKAGETDLPDVPTEQQIADEAWPGQQSGMITAVSKAITYGRLIEHQLGENKVTDVILQRLQSKNVEGAAD